MEGSSTRALAHVSDLHVGRDARTDAAAGRVCEALLAADVDQVLVTGDVTHRGLGTELADFERIFAPLRDRMVVAPGNHDRMGDDVARSPQRSRVEVERRPGLFVSGSTPPLPTTAPPSTAMASSRTTTSPRSIPRWTSRLPGRSSS
jgi:DNA repair exonuclease SbcCD nuclease subunit